MLGLKAVPLVFVELGGPPELVLVLLGGNDLHVDLLGLLEVAAEDENLKDTPSEMNQKMS